MRYEWDPAKAAANLKKHGVSFEEAATIFSDPLVLMRADEVHPDRCVAIGRSDRGRVLFVVEVEGSPMGRIVSARRATSHERRAYEEER